MLQVPSTVVLLNAPKLLFMQDRAHSHHIAEIFASLQVMFRDQIIVLDNLAFTGHVKWPLTALISTLVITSYKIIWMTESSKMHLKHSRICNFQKASCNWKCCSSALHRFQFKVVHSHHSRWKGVWNLFNWISERLLLNKNDICNFILKPSRGKLSNIHFEAPSMIFTF